VEWGPGGGHRPMQGPALATATHHDRRAHPQSWAIAGVESSGARGTRARDAASDHPSGARRGKFLRLPKSLRIGPLHAGGGGLKAAVPCVLSDGGMGGVDDSARKRSDRAKTGRAVTDSIWAVTTASDQ
jgi:hypothetical protein